MDEDHTYRWHLHRLSAMSPAEICYRLRQKSLTQTERIFWPESKRPSIDDFSKSWHKFHNQDAPFFFGWQERKLWVDLCRDAFPEEIDSTFLRGNRLFDHRISLFSQSVDYGDQISWHQDPLTGRNWPQAFYADVDIRDGETIGGVKWVWELNRHHHLVTLGKAYFLSGDERYAQEVCAQLESWIESNPPRIGVNWTSPLELALRLINWVWALAFIRDSEPLASETFGLVLQSVAQQTHHISRHLSAHSSANNHLIGEAGGLAIVGLFFPELPDAERWRDTGLGILEREIEKQIYPDGVPAEQALHYLAFVLDFNLLAWRLAELNGLSMPQIWYDRLEAACEFICHVMDEEGHVPAIGDSDDAWVVRLDDSPCANNHRSILATAAVLLDRPDFKAMAGRWDEKSHWLLGPSGKETFEALPSEPLPFGSRLFEEGGYCVMRAPGRVITFDCGSLGYLSIAAHGHADALSLTVSLEGQPILIDPGTYAYHEGGEKRNYFRSTAAHNTVVVDGEDQSEMLGAFLWGRKAEARLLQWESTEDYDVAVAEHDGYETLGLTHRRTVLFDKPNWLVVADCLQGEGEHSFEQLWHMPAECEVALDRHNRNQKHIRLSVRYQRVVLMLLETSCAVWPRIQMGEEQPLQGWVSPGYGQIEPAAVVTFSGRSHLPVRLVTALYLGSSPGDIEPSDLTAEALEIWSDFAEGVENL